jgi:hypothetical protein
MTTWTENTIGHPAPRTPRRGLGATAALGTTALGAQLLTGACGGPAPAAPTRAATPALGATAAAPTVASAAPSPASTPTTAATAAPGPASTPTTAASPAATSSPAAGVAVSPTPRLSAGRDVSQTRVRFAVGDAEIVVRLADNPTSRDFVSMLPLTLTFRDFNAMEMIGDVPRRPTTQDSTGRAPADGDLIYFVPWGNLGFFYNAARRDASFDDRVIPIGTVVTGHERLNALETGPVRVELVQ